MSGSDANCPPHYAGLVRYLLLGASGSLCGLRELHVQHHGFSGRNALCAWMDDCVAGILENTNPAVLQSVDIRMNGVACCPTPNFLRRLVRALYPVSPALTRFRLELPDLMAGTTSHDSVLAIVTWCSVLGDVGRIVDALAGDLRHLHLTLHHAPAAALGSLSQTVLAAAVAGGLEELEITLCGGTPLDLRGMLVDALQCKTRCLRRVGLTRCRCWPAQRCLPARMLGPPGCDPQPTDLLLPLGDAACVAVPGWSLDC